MDTQAVELLLDELKLPVPAAVAKARATLNALSVLDVPQQAEASRGDLAKLLRAQVERGEAADVVAMVRANREGAYSVEAADVVEAAKDLAEQLLKTAVEHSPGQLIPLLQARVDEIYAEVRKLPNTTPATSDEALRANESDRLALVSLQDLEQKHARLRHLHRLLIADAVSPHADQVLALFRDTRLPPAAWPSRVQPAQPAGPIDALARVRWLARPESQAWVPSAAEVSERYQEALRELQAPKAAPVAASGRS